LSVPSTGNLGIDISIAIVTGGAVTTWLTLLFDRTSKRRQEYIEISKEKILRITRIETQAMQMSSYLHGISNILNAEDKGKKFDHLYFMYLTGKYVHAWNEILNNTGYIQLDNIDSENVIQELAQHFYVKLQKSCLIGPKNLAKLYTLINEYPRYNAFIEKILSYDSRFQYSQYEELESKFKEYLVWIHNDQDDSKKEKKAILCRAEWFYRLFSIEVNLTYRIFYGEKDVTRHYQNKELLDREFLDYLAENHPVYFNRLRKMKII
jgi:hypothetical protein